jgi:protein-S-isoprenylcysteine O-methyltransferase Ste14
MNEHGHTMTGMSTRIVGWMLVGAQMVLLVLLIVLPGGGDWPTPRWVDVVAVVTVCAGLAVIAVSALGLGSALTPNPVPAERGELVTSGVYRLVRHPIYSGALLVVAGITIRSGSWWTALAALVLCAFFSVKSRFEERHLARRYAGYADYAAITPRFVPRARRRR